MSSQFHLHLISDATGETLNAIAKAACAQFEGVEVQDHFYALVRSQRAIAARDGADRAERDPGLVYFTLVNPELRRELEAFCAQLGLPCQGVLDAPIAMMRQFLGAAESHRPGGQHEVDQRYLHRIEALNYTIAHDDGQATDMLDDADVVLVGASRTSKTPTCVYLAIRGIRAANVPIVPGIPLPSHLLAAKRPLIVGLWASPDRLIQVRRNRLNTLGEVRDTELCRCGERPGGGHRHAEAVREQWVGGDRCFSPLSRGNRGRRDESSGGAAGEAGVTALILASGSAVRARLLKAAGIAFDVVPARVDEDAVKEALLAQNVPMRGIADALAELKAVRVSNSRPGALVLGADQVLVFDNELVSKSSSISEARATVAQTARAEAWQLIGATPCWRKTVSPFGDMWIVRRSQCEPSAMRSSKGLSPRTREGEAVLGSVGCYHLEGRGAQFVRATSSAIISRFSGLPLLPVLAALRDQGVKLLSRA